MEMSFSEKLILIMLSEIHEHLNIQDGIDPQFVQKAISSEQLWSLTWKYPGLVGSGKRDTPPIVHEVLDILEMWELLEQSYDQLQPTDKERIEDEAKPWGQDVRFPGFDGNNETEYMGTAGVLINDLDRFSTFKGRDLNSHMPVLGTYKQMLAKFTPIKRSVLRSSLNAEQIVEILNA